MDFYIFMIKSYFMILYLNYFYFLIFCFYFMLNVKSIVWLVFLYLVLEGYNVVYVLLFDKKK